MLLIVLSQFLLLFLCLPILPPEKVVDPAGKIIEPEAQPSPSSPGKLLVSDVKKGNGTSLDNGLRHLLKDLSNIVLKPSTASSTTSETNTGNRKSLDGLKREALSLLPESIKLHVSKIGSRINEKELKNGLQTYMHHYTRNVAAYKRNSADSVKFFESSERALAETLIQFRTNNFLKRRH